MRVSWRWLFSSCETEALYPSNINVPIPPSPWQPQFYFLPLSLSFFSFGGSRYTHVGAWYTWHFLTGLWGSVHFCSIFFYFFPAFLWMGEIILHYLQVYCLFPTLNIGDHSKSVSVDYLFYESGSQFLWVCCNVMLKTLKLLDFFVCDLHRLKWCKLYCSV